jgi:hypothetical protein
MNGIARLQTGGPIATDVVRQDRTLDPATRELFFGAGIPGTSSYSPGFLQQVFRASDRTFFDDQGRPVVVPEQVAGLSPDQIDAINRARTSFGIQDRFLTGEEGSQGAEQLFRGGLESLFGREVLDKSGQPIGRRVGGLDEAEKILRQASDIQYDPTQQITLDDGTQRSYISKFYDPFQEEVIDQVTSDILEAGEKQDILARARDVSSGESAFGSRARLGAEDRARMLGRGLSETLAQIRSGGFQQAQNIALDESQRRQQSLGNLASGLSGLGQARQRGQIGLGGQLVDLGTQLAQSRQSDVQNQLGIGGFTQGMQQAQLDVARRNALAQQQAPLQQMQSLLPFVQSVPAGFSQTATTFGVPPSPLQTGLGVGLSALGGLGSFFNPQPTYNPYANFNRTSNVPSTSSVPPTTTTTQTPSNNVVPNLPFSGSYGGFG